MRRSISGVFKSRLSRLVLLAILAAPLGVGISATWTALQEGEAALRPEPPNALLVVDIDGDGIELAALNEKGSVYWDIDQDDFLEASSWIKGGDGVLAVDINGDGIISDQGEVLTFERLKKYDEKRKGEITSADPQYGQLLLWIDENADGYSQKKELAAIQDRGVTVIHLKAKAAGTPLSGSAIQRQGSVIVNGRKQKLVSVALAYDDVNSKYGKDFKLDIRTLFLPDLRGYGTLPDLHIAMSMDKGLFERVQRFAASWSWAAFSDPVALDAQIEDILLRWAGAEVIDPASRGKSTSRIDARHLVFLEKFVGRPFNNDAGSAPSEQGWRELEKSWTAAFENNRAALLIQSPAGGLFAESAHFNPATGNIEGSRDLSQSIVESLVPFAAASNARAYWTGIARFLQYAKGLNALTPAEQGWLDAAVRASDPTLTWSDISQHVVAQ